MAGFSSVPEFTENSSDDALELNKDLDRMIENTENISVQLTWMAYDLVALRTSPELAVSMRKLEEAYRRCRAVVCGDRHQQPEMGKQVFELRKVKKTQVEQMENTEKSTEQATLTACNDLGNILKGLESLSNCMDQLALRTELRQCDLIIHFGHPDMQAFLKVQEPLRQQPAARPETEA